MNQPPDFSFQLNAKETADLMAILVGVLTEQGIDSSTAWRIRAKHLAVKIVGQTSDSIAADLLKGMKEN